MSPFCSLDCFWMGGNLASPFMLSGYDQMFVQVSRHLDLCLGHARDPNTSPFVVGFFASNFADASLYSCF